MVLLGFVQTNVRQPRGILRSTEAGRRRRRDRGLSYANRLPVNSYNRDKNTPGSVSARNELRNHLYDLL